MVKTKAAAGGGEFRCGGESKQTDEWLGQPGIGVGRHELKDKSGSSARPHSRNQRPHFLRDSHHPIPFTFLNGHNAKKGNLFDV
uniref:Uncharacterized protein n=1 Tax=Globodera rostochiensis TaxID=31243 RepID=A0A914GY94_GLORO